MCLETKILSFISQFQFNSQKELKSQNFKIKTRHCDKKNNNKKLQNVNIVLYFTILTFFFELRVYAVSSNSERTLLW